MKKRKDFKKGFGLIEVVVGISIISSSVFFTMFTAQLSQRVMRDGSSKLQASFLAEEGVEAVKTIRDESWQTNITSLQEGVSHHLYFDGLLWTATSSVIYIDNLFDRFFKVESVKRDANDDISSVGTNDPNTKKITVSVSWKGRAGTTTESISTYITNLFSN